MDFYIVVKTINGRRYYYRQKTWREGKRVRTLSIYIGPVGAEPGPAATPNTPVVKNRAEEALGLLMGEPSANWDHSWSADRNEPSIVKKSKRIDAMLKELAIDWTHNTTGAYYNPRTGQVNIPPARCFMDKDGQSATQAYCAVLFHELVHWTMAPIRVNRPTNSSDLHAYAQEELVAELGAIMMMHALGLELGNTTEHARYFQTWLHRTGNKDAALVYVTLFTLLESGLRAS